MTNFLGKAHKYGELPFGEIDNEMVDDFGKALHNYLYYSQYNSLESDFHNFYGLIIFGENLSISLKDFRKSFRLYFSSY